MDSSLQIALSIGVPTLAVLVGILISNSRLGDMNSRMSDMNSRMADMNSRLGDLRAHMDSRFDDMKDMWRSELHRVEEVLDARLKHLEER
jgi:flagellar capping protein FliD